MNTPAPKLDIDALVRTAPQLSASASRLLEITSDPNHELIDVIDMVKTDATLTAKVLKVVNSAAFGLVASITTIDRAVSYLGERIVVGVAVDDCAASLYLKELTGYEAAAGELWHHNLCTAVASREVVVQAGVPVSPDLAFTAGLLHDLGKALISGALSGSTEQVLREIESGARGGYASAEEGLLGFDHAHIGFELARAWKLPEVHCQAMRYHHRPAEADAPHRALVYAVHLGDHIAMLGGRGTGADCLQHPLDSNYVDYVDLDERSLMVVMMNVEEEFSKLVESLGTGIDRARQ